MRIGRAPECELVLKDNRVSRRHARLAARDGVLILTDLGSTNGTRVNGNRVTEVVLGAGDMDPDRRDQPRRRGHRRRGRRAPLGRAPMDAALLAIWVLRLLFLALLYAFL